MDLPGPMLLNEATEQERSKFLASDDWLLQPKFDGHRCFLYCDEHGKVSGISRVGNQKGLDARIIQAAQAWLRQNNQPFIIDGELIGETYVCFDVLRLGDTDVWRQPASYRAGQVQVMWHEPGSIIGATTAFTRDQKERLYQACYRQGLEGVVLKKKSTPYKAGRPSFGGNGLKVKFWNTASVISLGQHGSKSSFEMGLADGREMGTCTIPPGKQIPRAGVVCEIKYLYVHDVGRKFVQPVFLGVRDDIRPEECTADQLRVKGEPRKGDVEYK